MVNDICEPKNLPKAYLSKMLQDLVKTRRYLFDLKSQVRVPSRSKLIKSLESKTV